MVVGLAIDRPGMRSRYGVSTSPLIVLDDMAAGLHTIASPIEQRLKLKAGGAYLTTVGFGDAARLAATMKELRK